MVSFVILTSHSDTSLTVKQQILQQQVGGRTSNLTTDHGEVPDNKEEVNFYPQEILHTLKLSGMTPHTLQLKVGCIGMLLRNLD